MRLGVNTLPGPYSRLRAHEAEFLAKVLRIARTVMPDLDLRIFVDAKDEAMFPGLPTCRAPERRGFLGGSPLGGLLEQSPVDVLLSPLSLAAPKTSAPQVLLALDTADFEADAPKKHAQQQLKAAKRACAEARRLVVTSDYLRRRCLDLFEAPLNKVTVAPPGVDESFAHSGAPLVEPPYTVLLQSPLTEAALPTVRHTLQPHQGEGHMLVVLGSWQDDPAQWPDLIHFEQCSDAHRASLFHHATCCIYPAEHDGCALRLLEIMRAGALVACANTAACKEYGGDIPIHFNPQNARSLQHALERLGAFSPERREERSRLAVRAAARFDWEKCAWKLLIALKQDE